jgi:hypothetical protein
LLIVFTVFDLFIVYKPWWLLLLDSIGIINNCFVVILMFFKIKDKIISQVNFVGLGVRTGAKLTYQSPFTDPSLPKKL